MGVERAKGMSKGGSNSATYGAPKQNDSCLTHLMLRWSIICFSAPLLAARETREGKRSRPSLIKHRPDFWLLFDLMEPLRPIMDGKILEFITSRTFSPEDFILNKEGICRLHPQFARFIVKLVQDMPEIEEITAANLKKLFGKIKTI